MFSSFDDLKFIIEKLPPDVVEFTFSIKRVQPNRLDPAANRV